MKFRTVLTAVVCGGAAVPACFPPAPDHVPSVDEASLLDEIAGYRSSGDLAKITARAYPSAVSTGADIDVWISSFGAVAYGAVDPDRTGSGIRLPEGTLIVREVLDAAGALRKLTLMAKGPAGYNPEVGDYWFGVTDPAGTPIVENGVELRGKLTQCYSCHQARGVADDYLFGIPALARGAVDGGSGQPPPPPAPPGAFCGDFVCDPTESHDTCWVDCYADEDDD